MRALTVVTYKPDANDNISKPCRAAQGQMCWFRLWEKNVCVLRTTGFFRFISRDGKRGVKLFSPVLCSQSGAA